LTNWLTCSGGARVVCAADGVQVGVAGGPSRALLVGLGFGGYVAMAFAAAHPTLVVGLCLADVRRRRSSRLTPVCMPAGPF
jgi:pimeloyl-ACP methyl ester carboxylesterase